MKTTISFDQFLHPYEDENIELLFLPSPQFPESNGTVVYIHGFCNFGAWDMLFMAQHLVRQGYNVILPSQCGFGYSNGPRDYYGPKTISGIVDGLKEVIEEKELNSHRIAVYGLSRGASVAALLAMRHPHFFKAAIFQAGAYDLRKYYEWNGKDEGINKNIEKEAGLSDEAFRERSAIFEAEKISCPVLILHGAEDDNIPPSLAVEFAEKLKKFGKDCTLHLVPGGGHQISGPELRREHMFPFLEEKL
ncbi:MAG TPA: alpha/beta fold hydrolase [Candidatus Paceibacterota bacterium]|nr:alpha/beta fold hydrolase [Candidatus Paceibacterota bacterium]